MIEGRCLSYSEWRAHRHWPSEAESRSLRNSLRADGLVSEAGLIARDKLSLPVSPARSVFKRGGSCGNSPPRTGLARQFRSICSRGGGGGDVPMSTKHPLAHYRRHFCEIQLRPLDVKSSLRASRMPRHAPLRAARRSGISAWSGHERARSSSERQDFLEIRNWQILESRRDQWQGWNSGLDRAKVFGWNWK